MHENVLDGVKAHCWRVESLELFDFRNCVKTSALFGPGINWICGQNGQGKTSLLEALYVCLTGQSFRTPLLRELIRYAQNGFHIKMHCVRLDVAQTIRMSYTPKEKQVWHNQTLHASCAALCGRFPCVVMTSDDIQCVRGPPQGRRQLLDHYLCQIDPLYSHHQSRYTKSLKQRNFLLKERSFSLLDVWEEQLAQAGAYIAMQRFQATEALSELANKRYQRLTPFAKTFILQYETDAPLHTADLELISRYYLTAYKQQREKESFLGMTLTGPHREDLALLLDEHPVRSFASEGEQRSCISALALAQLDGLKNQTGIEPIVLVDDLAISLDEARTMSFLQQLQDVSQVFITTAQAHHETLLRSLCDPTHTFQCFMMHDGLMTRV